MRTHALWRRNTNFDTVTHIHVLGFPCIYAYTPCQRTTKFHVVIWRGWPPKTSPSPVPIYGDWGGACFRGQARPPSQGGVDLANPNFAGSPLLTRKRLDLEQPKSARYGSGMFQKVTNAIAFAVHKMRGAVWVSCLLCHDWTITFTDEHILQARIMLFIRESLSLTGCFSLKLHLISFKLSTTKNSTSLTHWVCKMICA